MAKLVGLELEEFPNINATEIQTDSSQSVSSKLEIYFGRCQ